MECNCVDDLLTIENLRSDLIILCNKAIIELNQIKKISMEINKTHIKPYLLLRASAEIDKINQKIEDVTTTLKK